MRGFTGWIIAAVVGFPGWGVGLQAQENQLPLAEIKAGWKPLFDGKSVDAWRNFKKQTVNPAWQVREGTLVRAADGAGDIITRDQYGNFELLLEYRIGKGGNSGNSGPSEAVCGYRRDRYHNIKKSLARFGFWQDKTI